MTDILLIQPREIDADQILNLPSLPLGLLSVSTLLHRDYDIQIVDQRLPGNWQASILEALEAKPLVVGVTCLTGHQIHFAIEVSDFVRAHSDVPIVWGGLHFPVIIEQALAHPSVDGVVSGEGEQTFLEVVQALAAGRSPGGIPCYWSKEDGAIVEPPSRPFLDFDSLPDLPYHLVDLKQYLRFRKDGASIVFESSRGCPNRCGFCACNFYSHRWRAMSAERVVENILRFHREFGASMVVIVDDNFFVDKKRANAIFESLVKAGSPVTLDLQGVRVDSLERMTDEELTLMHRAGVVKINVGIESGSQRILEFIKKDITVERAIAQNHRLSKTETYVQYNFITGFPTETEAEMKETIELALRLLKNNPKAMLNYFCVFSPLPGTELYDFEKQQGKQLPQSIEEWADYDRIYLNRRETGDIRKTNVPLNFVSLFVDRKIEYYSPSKLLHRLVSLYRPVARYRFARQNFNFLVEKWFFDRLNRLSFGRM